MTLRQRSEQADRIVDDLIVKQGLSYDDAIRRCLDEATRIEQEAFAASAPYREVAAELQRKAA
jgi:hypothetical protein